MLGTYVPIYLGSGKTVMELHAYQKKKKKGEGELYNSPYGNTRQGFEASTFLSSHHNTTGLVSRSARKSQILPPSKVPGLGPTRPTTTSFSLVTLARFFYWLTRSTSHMTNFNMRCAAHLGVCVTADMHGWAFDDRG
jgi:hypothetical protein